MLRYSKKVFCFSSPFLMVIDPSTDHSLRVSGSTGTKSGGFIVEQPGSTSSAVRTPTRIVFMVSLVVIILFLSLFSDSCTDFSGAGCCGPGFVLVRVRMTTGVDDGPARQRNISHG